jgi:hypothetical protein
MALLSNSLRNRYISMHTFAPPGICAAVDKAVRPQRHKTVPSSQAAEKCIPAETGAHFAPIAVESLP